MMPRLMPANRWLSRLNASEGWHGIGGLGYRDVSVIVFSVAALIAAFVAVPSSDQIAYSLIRDKKHIDARDLLGDIDVGGERGLHAAMALHRLHLRFGELARAEQILKAIIQVNPNKVELIRAAATFYKVTHRPKQRAEMLLRLLTLAPSRETLDQTLSHLRLFGELKLEARLLHSLADSPILSTAHHTRLGLLYANEKNYLPAIRHLSKAATSDVAARRPALRLLISRGALDDVRKVLQTWVSGSITPQEVFDFHQELNDAKLNSIAIDFLEAAVVRGHISREQARQNLDQ